MQNINDVPKENIWKQMFYLVSDGQNIHNQTSFLLFPLYFLIEC